MCRGGWTLGGVLSGMKHHPALVPRGGRGDDAGIDCGVTARPTRPGARRRRCWACRPPRLTLTRLWAVSSLPVHPLLVFSSFCWSRAARPPSPGHRGGGGRVRVPLLCSRGHRRWWPVVLCVGSAAADTAAAAPSRHLWLTSLPPLPRPRPVCRGLWPCGSGAGAGRKRAAAGRRWAAAVAAEGGVPRRRWRSPRQVVGEGGPAPHSVPPRRRWRWWWRPRRRGRGWRRRPPHLAPSPSSAAATIGTPLDTRLSRPPRSP